MSIVFLPRASQVDAHDIARAVSRLSVISYIQEEEEDEESSIGQVPGDDTTGIPPNESVSAGLDTVICNLQRASSGRASVRKIPKWKIMFNRFKEFYDKYGLKHVSPILVLFLYSLIGAGLFCVIEKQNEIDKLKSNRDKSDISREKTVHELERILKDGKMTQETRLFAIRDLISWYEQELGLHDPPSMQWDMWGALFYVGTIYTTIGYGNIYCETTSGRVLTIFYAIFGIPLVLAILSDLGSLFCKWINLFWKKVKKMVGKKAQVYTKKISFGPHVFNNTTSSDKSKEKENASKNADEDLHEVPVSLACTVMFFWLFFCSSLFLAWEKEWSYFQAVYFFFISLSTIGLGDVTPDQPKLMVVNFGLVIVGLSLVSMTINVIQQNIEAFLFRVLKMIQEEYQAAIEAGLLPKEDDVVDKVFAKQPWYMRKMAPVIMTQNQKKQLAEIINFTQKMVVDTGVQCVSVKQVTNKDASVQVRMANLEMYTQTSEDEFETVSLNDEDINHHPAPPPPPVMVDTAVQTALIPVEPLPALSNLTVAPGSSENLESPPTPTDLSPRQFRMPSIFLTTENEEPVNISMSCVSTKDEEVQVTCPSGVGGMTIIEASFATNFVDKICQTDDSYLKLAKKLESLKVNRAKSLAIWSAPTLKKTRPAPVVLDSTPE